MQRFVLVQFAAFAVLIGLLGMAAFGLLLWDFQDPGSFKVWGLVPGDMGLNLAVLLLFGVQHSVMARPGFKRVWTRLVPADLERSLYVMFSGVMLLLIAGLWTPTDPPLYDLRGTAWQWPIHLLAGLGGVVIAVAGIGQGGLDLIGVDALRRIWKGAPADVTRPFATPNLYRVVRHPLYLGMLLLFWVTPAMTHDHLLFAEVMTAYILLGAALEEEQLVRRYGDAYRAYRREVPMLLPWRGWRRKG
jgi:methanethiol S-methyltransferase